MAMPLPTRAQQVGLLVLLGVVVLLAYFRI
jgi:hypothetical protein